MPTITDDTDTRAIVESGDLITFGPAGEKPRLTMQRVGGIYEVKSGDGRQAVKAKTWPEAEVAAFKIVGAK